ncbi:hypothetical protein BB559_002908 [Furculomyces boomerangus]|uniref:Uncharacterized protein n=1 Tax=Furculomyces boomerangus TaxID=61424 RepID=A0A2T9YRD1_9FUNG|nr:hypothetical protein BB559_002908 [Furculomyces boomerangus]
MDKIYFPFTVQKFSKLNLTTKVDLKTVIGGINLAASLDTNRRETSGSESDEDAKESIRFIKEFLDKIQPNYINLDSNVLMGFNNKAAFKDVASNGTDDLMENLLADSNNLDTCDFETSIRDEFETEEDKISSSDKDIDYDSEDQDGLELFDSLNSIISENEQENLYEDIITQEINEDDRTQIIQSMTCTFQPLWTQAPAKERIF